MDPLTTEPLGDSGEDFDCSVEPTGGTSSDHNSPKSSSTLECSPYASAVEIADTVYTREEHFLSDNGDISTHSNTKPILLPNRSTGFRLSDGHKKSVQMQFEGRKVKSSFKSSMKKEKQPVCVLDGLLLYCLFIIHFNRLTCLSTE